MITITYQKLKTKKVETLCFASLDLATKKLAEVGAKPKQGESLVGRKYVLMAVSYETKAEKDLCLPYIYPELEEE